MPSLAQGKVLFVGSCSVMHPKNAQKTCDLDFWLWPWNSV